MLTNKSQKRTSLGRAKATTSLKKKFNSAEKVKSNPFRVAPYSQEDQGSLTASEYGQSNPFSFASKIGGDDRDKKYRVKQKLNFDSSTESV